MEQVAPWSIDTGEALGPVWPGNSSSSSGVVYNHTNAVVEYLYDDAPPVRRDRNLPPTDGKDTHECPRRETRAQGQMFHFLADGVVTQPCGDHVCKSRTY